MPLATLTKQQKIEAVMLLEEKAERLKQNKALRWYNSFYEWQSDFTASTKEHHESCLCAGNRTGKTRTGLTSDAFHLLGDYPEDWPGHKFDFAPMCWGLGFSMEKTRDLLQNPLFGDYSPANGFTGGLVPKERIHSWESATGTPNAMRTVRVKHKNNGLATIQFWSYSQGQHAIMGDNIDWFHIDEEPRDQAIRPQVLTRSVHGDRGRGGRGIYTFTPENGRTQLVIKFMDEPSKAQFFMKKGWDECPHITEETAQRLLDGYPEHQRDMRMKGEPMLGHGRIYDLSDDFVLCEPFDIPNHYNIISGMDFGWDHPQAFIQIATDMDNDIDYITHSWKASKVSANDAWGATKGWVKQYPVAWPHDGLMHEKGRDDAVQQKQHYSNAGFKMLADHATWVDGGNSVENGIYDILHRARTGKLKIFKGQSDLMNEWRQYHRNDKGRIVKIMDDMLDAIRYAYMMKRYAMRKGDLHVTQKTYIPQPLKTMGR